MVVAEEDEEEDYLVEYVKVSWFDKCNNQGRLSLPQLEQLQCHNIDLLYSSAFHSALSVLLSSLLSMIVRIQPFTHFYFLWVLCSYSLHLLHLIFFCHFIGSNLIFCL